MLGMRFPESYGGADADTVASVVFAEELGRSTFGGFAITILTQTDTASPPIAAVGTPQQKARYLPAIVRGECLVAIAMTEPDVGSDIATLRTRAVRDGDEWVLDGAKTFITNGVHADLYVVAARTDASARPSQGVSLFLVDKGTPGLAWSAAWTRWAGKAPTRRNCLSMAAACLLAPLLGEPNRGFAALMRNVQNERLVLAAQALGSPRPRSPRRWTTPGCARPSAPPCGTNRPSGTAWPCWRRGSKAPATSSTASPPWMRAAWSASRKSR